MDLLGIRGPNEDDDERYRLHRRFDRMGRLVGDPGMKRLRNARVMVIGMGGVGSWAAESMVRSGVGRVDLVDFDLVCVTNANRQLHAMKGTTGKPKVDVMAERLGLINPSAQVVAHRQFYEAQSSEALLATGPDLVIDAIDNLTAKGHLISQCLARGISLVVSGGASGRMDPTQIRITDLNAVQGDPFIAATRKLLRKQYPERFAPADDKEQGKKPWGIPTVHSLEPAAQPLDLDYDAGDGFRCVCPQGDNGKHTCDQRSIIYGTAGFVTGAFGLACASAAVKRLLSA